MVWLSTTTCTPRRPHRGLRPPLLHNMRLSLRWLPSMAKRENLERVLFWRAKMYMWSIHKCDHKNLGHFKSNWGFPIAILHSPNLPRSASDSQDVCHASWQNCPAIAYKHPPMLSPLLACCAFPPLQGTQ